MSDVEEEVLNAQPSPEELADFKTRVSEWTKIDDQIKKLNIAVRERRLHQKVLSDGIKTFMTKYGYGNLNTNQGRILHTVKTIKQPLKINEIRQIILDNIHSTPEELFKKIFESERPVVKKESIKRVIPNVSMHLEI